MRQSFLAASKLKLMWTRCLIGSTLLILLAGVPVWAKDPPALFDQANKLYEQGKYNDAISAYEEIVKSGHTSAALHFNLGNAWLKTDRLGYALLHYRLAARLSPRDAEVRQNLLLARARIQENAAVSASWWRWTRLLSLDELTWIVLAAWCLWWSALAVGQFLPERQPMLRKLAKVVGGVAAVFGLWLGWLWYAEIGSGPALVIAREAVVRLGPFEESQSAFVLHDGTELRVQGRKLDWAQVQDATGRRGWLRLDQVAMLNRAEAYRNRAVRDPR